MLVNHFAFLLTITLANNYLDVLARHKNNGILETI